ncbi:MAG: cellulose biosynthesis cyclic di-GMP-binding regulatory protein BcsB [Chloroflexi bacterium]|nr:cellulose biosynthesis cyclic di-GMP-binding regulatory protein BcsB [Chloroflexota bacterium]
MKKKIFMVVGFLGLFLASPLLVAAQSLGVAPALSGSTLLRVGENKVSVSFEELGYQDLDLISPLDSTRVIFSIPPNWRLAEGGAIELNYDVLLSGADIGRIREDQRPYGGAITVTFNKQVIGHIYLDATGSQTMRFQIPAAALASVRKDGRHELGLLLDAQFSCIYDIRTLIVVKSTSFFDLSFEVSPPELDLSRLPAPFFVRNSLLPDRTLFVIPDDPDAGELQAALNVITGFGSMVGQGFDFELVKVGQLSQDDLALNNFIFVGTPDKFDLLSDVQFPSSVVDGGFANLLPESTQDGIIQLALSPWNANKAVMLVSGNSVDAVNKAAQAVSSGKLFIYENPSLIYVADVQLLVKTLPIVEDFSFQDLGYPTETLTGIGVDSTEYLFYVSKDQVSTEDGYIDLIYYHSGLLDYGISSFSVALNDQVIASTAFSEESVRLSNMRITLPAGLLRFGENRLVISAKMQPEYSCDTTGFSDPWLTISNQSGFHIPVALTDSFAGLKLLDLKFYPDLMLTHSDLGDVAFVLPRADLESWNIAARLAFGLGQTANPMISDLSVAYADDVPQKVRSERSLIVVGKASTLPLLVELNESLPAPFDFKNDTASERQMQIIYRIPPGVSVGYLELLASPFNPQKAILVVAGNDDTGLLMAGDTLLQGELSSQLAGLFAVTNGTQVATSSISSAFSIVGTVVPNAEGIVATPISALAGDHPVYERPGWLLPMLIVSALVILATIGYIVVAAISRGRSLHVNVVDDDARIDDAEDDS